MRATIKMFVVVMLVLSILTSAATAAVGPDPMAPLASDYIRSTSATVNPRGNGKIYVEFTITGTGTMTKLGAMTVEIYRSDGTCVKSCNYTQDDYTYFMAYNIHVHRTGLEYNGMPGTTYYAVVYFYAGNGSGSDGYVYTTLPATA